MVVGVNILFLHMVSLCEQRGTQLYNIPKRRNLSSSTNASTNAQAMVCGELGWSNLITHIVDIYSSPNLPTILSRGYFNTCSVKTKTNDQFSHLSRLKKWVVGATGQRGGFSNIPRFFQHTQTHTAFAHRRFGFGISKNQKTDEWTDCKRYPVFSMGFPNKNINCLLSRWNMFHFLSKNVDWKLQDLRRFGAGTESPECLGVRKTCGIQKHKIRFKGFLGCCLWCKCINIRRLVD